MATFKKLDATPWPAAAISHAVPLTKLEWWIIIHNLYNGQATSLEHAKKSRSLYEVVSKDWSWEQYAKKGGIAASEFEEVVDPPRVVTKDQIKFLEECAKEWAARLQGRDAFACLDLADRIFYILNAETK